MPTTITVNDNDRYVDGTGLTYKEFVLLAADLSRAVYQPNGRRTIAGYYEQRSHTQPDSGVWINPLTRHGFVVYKGTNKLEEWLYKNPHIVCNTMAYSSAFQQATELYDNVVADFGSVQFDVTGHSLGGAKALFVANARDEPFAMTYNAGIGSRMMTSLLEPGRRLFPPRNRYLVVRNSSDFASMNRLDMANEYTLTNTRSSVFSIGFNPISQHSINQFTTAAFEDGSWDLPDVYISSVVRGAANLPMRVLAKLAELVRLHRTVYDQVEEPYILPFQNLFNLTPHQLHNALVRDIMDLRERMARPGNGLSPLHMQNLYSSVAEFTNSVEADMGAHIFAQEQASQYAVHRVHSRPPNRVSIDEENEDFDIRPSKKPRIRGRQQVDALVDGDELTEFQKRTEYTQQPDGTWKQNPTSGGHVEPVDEGEVFRGGENVFRPGEIGRIIVNPKIDAQGYDHTPVVSTSSTSSSTVISTSSTKVNGLNIQLPHDISLSVASNIRNQVTEELERRGPLNLITQEELDQLVEIIISKITGVTKKLPADIPDAIEVLPEVPTVVPRPEVPPTWRPFPRFDAPPEVPPGVPPEAGLGGDFVDVPLDELPVIGAGVGVEGAAEQAAIGAEIALGAMFLPLDVLNMMSLGRDVDKLWNKYKSDSALKKTGWYKHLTSASDNEGFFESIGFWEVSDRTRADRIYKDYSNTLEYNENIFESQNDYNQYVQTLEMAKAMGSGDSVWINFAQVAKAYEREQEKDKEYIKNWTSSSYSYWGASKGFAGSNITVLDAGQTLAYQYALLDKYHKGGRDWVSPSSTRAIVSAVARNAQVNEYNKHNRGGIVSMDEYPTYEGAYDVWQKTYALPGFISDLGPGFDLNKILGPGPSMGNLPPGSTLGEQTNSVTIDNNMDDFHETRFYTKYPGTDNLINLDTLSYGDVSKLSANDIYIPTPKGTYQAVGHTWANTDLSAYVSGRKKEPPGSHHDVEGGTSPAASGGLKPGNGQQGVDPGILVVPPHQQDPIIGQPSGTHPPVIPHGGGSTPDMFYPGHVTDGWLGPDTNVHAHDTNNHISNNPESMSEPAYDSAIKRFMHGSVTSRSVMASRGMNFTRFAEIADLNSTLATKAADMLAT